MDNSTEPANPWLMDPAFMERVEFTEDGCWEWTGYRQDDGYGSLSRDGVNWLAHRWSYALVKGLPPQGQPLDHLCRNRSCVNPDHLELVTPLVNSQRAPNWSGNRSHCPEGHPYDEANTIVKGDGKRRCRTCNNRRERERMARKRAQERLVPKPVTSPSEE